MVCQEDCQFTDYDYEISVAKCSCDVKETPKTIAEMNIDKTKLLDNFINLKNIANFNFLVCYQSLFSKKGIENNIDSYAILTIIFFHIITLFTFYINQFYSLKKKIAKIRNLFLKKINNEQLVTSNTHINITFSSKIKFKKKQKR